MAQFTVNPQRFDPYKNFKFRVKWDGRYVAGISKVGALKRTTEVVEHREGGDPSHQPQVAGPHEVRGDHARARRHPRPRVRDVGEQGLELRRRARRGGLARRLPQGHHHRAATTRPGSWRSPTRCSAAGCRNTRRCRTSTPTPTPSRSSTSSSRTRAGSATPTVHGAHRALLRLTPDRAEADRCRWPDRIGHPRGLGGRAMGRPPLDRAMRLLGRRRTRRRPRSPAARPSATARLLELRRGPSATGSTLCAPARRCGAELELELAACGRLAPRPPRRGSRIVTPRACGQLTARSTAADLAPWRRRRARRDRSPVCAPA